MYQSSMGAQNFFKKMDFAFDEIEARVLYQQYMKFYPQHAEVLERFMSLTKVTQQKFFEVLQSIPEAEEKRDHLDNTQTEFKSYYVFDKRFAQSVKVPDGTTYNIDEGYVARVVPILIMDREKAAEEEYDADNTEEV